MVLVAGLFSNAPQQPNTTNKLLKMQSFCECTEPWRQLALASIWLLAAVMFESPLLHHEDILSPVMLLSMMGLFFQLRKLCSLEFRSINCSPVGAGKKISPVAANRSGYCVCVPTSCLICAIALWITFGSHRVSLAGVGAGHPAVAAPRSLNDGAVEFI